MGGSESESEGILDFIHVDGVVYVCICMYCNAQDLCLYPCTDQCTSYALRLLSVSLARRGKQQSVLQFEVIIMPVCIVFVFTSFYFLVHVQCDNWFHNKQCLTVHFIYKEKQSMNHYKLRPPAWWDLGNCPTDMHVVVEDNVFVMPSMSASMSVALHFCFAMYYVCNISFPFVTFYYFYLFEQSVSKLPLSVLVLYLYHNLHM